MADASSETKVGTTHSTGKAQPIRVYFLDDDLSVLKTLCLLTRRENDFEVIGAESSAERAMVDVPRKRPDVFITDLRMTTLSGIDCARHIRRLLPEVKILILTAFADQTNILEAFQAGIDGYLVKPSSTATLPQAIRKVFRGEPVVAEPALTLLIENLKTASRRCIDGRLSPRECEVMSLIMLAKRDKEIARALRMTEATVHCHTRSIYKKLGAHNWKQAVEAYVALGEKSTSPDKRPNGSARSNPPLILKAGVENKDQNKGVCSSAP